MELFAIVLGGSAAVILVTLGVDISMDSYHAMGDRWRAKQAEKEAKERAEKTLMEGITRMHFITDSPIFVRAHHRQHGAHRKIAA